MIDDEPAGHIGEYFMLREQGVPLALCRPQGGGSTFMIGTDNVEHIRTFEYELSPLEVVQAAVNWAENLLRERTDRNNNFPWRRR
jgi:hypothetical protein